MKKAIHSILVIAFVLLLCSPAPAALPAAATWELRTAGADPNGGCYVAGATGTDFSQQAASQFNGTDLTVDAVTNTKVTSVAHSFAATDVGNCIHISAGAGFTLNFFRIVSVASGAATLDRSPAAVGTSGGTWAEGGAIQSWATLATGLVAGNVVFVKNDGTYSLSAGVTLTGGNPTITIPIIRIVGYTTTRTDAGRPTIQLSTNAGLTALTFSTNGFYFKNFIIDANSLGTSTCIATGASINVKIFNVKCMNFTTNGITSTGGDVVVSNSEITGGTSCTAGINFSGSRDVITQNWIHDLACPAMTLTTSNGVPASIQRNLITNITGASHDAISDTTCNGYFEFNTIYGATRDGIRCSNNTSIGAAYVRNNVIAGMGAFGLNGNSSGQGTPASPEVDGNCYWNNTGNRTNIDDTTTNPQNGVGAYTNVFDVALAASPFVNAAGNDFRLNNNNPGGLQCRAVQAAGTWAGTGLTSYADMGAFQHQDSGSGQQNTAFVQ